MKKRHPTLKQLKTKAKIKTIVDEQETFCLLALFKTVQFVSLKCTFKMILPILLQRQSSMIKQLT